MSVGSDYQQLLAAIQSYYGAGSNEWLAFAQYGLNADNAAAILRQVPGVSSQITKDGRVLSFSLDSNIPLTDGGTALSVVNSNVQSGTAAAANTLTTRTVGTMVKDATTGEVTMTSQLPKKIGGVSTTAPAAAVKFSNVIAAANVGFSIGKTINRALSAEDPTFWSRVTAMPPEGSIARAAWEGITDAVDKVDPDGKVQHFLEGLVGWEPSGKTQTYMSDDAYAYYAYMLAQEGMFDTGNEKEGTAEISAYPTSMHFTQPVIYTKHLEYIASEFSHPYQVKYEYDILSPGVYFVCNVNSETWSSMFIAEDGFVGNVLYHEKMTRVSNGNVIRDENSTWSLNNTTAYAGYTGKWNTHRSGRLENFDVTFEAIDFPSSELTPASSTALLTSSGLAWNAAYILNRGSIHSDDPVPGTGNQPGATTPDTTGWTDPAATKESLQNQYPDLWDNAYEVTTIDDDGNEHTTVYIPVPIPDEYDDNGSPTGGETGTQQDPEVDPDDATDDMLKTIIDLLSLLRVTPESVTDPESETDDGDQTTDPNPPDTGDGTTPPIVVPTGSASALWSVYNPTQQDINDLGSWLWSTNFVTQLLQMFNDPMQAIIGLHKTFITPTTGATQNIKVGYLDSGISSLTVPTQYSTMDCGSVNLSEYFGNVFDYTPYTRVYIYLPFIGFRELDVSQVMRSSIGVKYHGDAYTGACLAEISVTRDGGAGGVLYTYGGDCAVRYPLSHGSYMGIVNAIATLGVGVAGAALGAGGLGIMGGLSAFQNARLSVEHSGSFDGCSGAMGIKKPYLVVMRPQTAMPANYKHFSGRPSSSLVQIAETSGLIRVRECHVDEIPNATKEEKAMIDKALHDGILVS